MIKYIADVFRELVLLFRKEKRRDRKEVLCLIYEIAAIYDLYPHDGHFSYEKFTGRYRADEIKNSEKILSALESIGFTCIECRSFPLLHSDDLEVIYFLSHPSKVKVVLFVYGDRYLTPLAMIIRDLLDPTDPYFGS